MERCCEELLTLEGYKEDIDGLAGRGKAFLRERGVGRRCELFWKKPLGMDVVIGR